MTIHILTFGIAKEIFGSAMVKIELPSGATTKDLKILLEERYPELRQLASYLVAANNEYADDDRIVLGNDEVAIIPPVSGG